MWCRYLGCRSMIEIRLLDSVRFRDGIQSGRRDACPAVVALLVLNLLALNSLG